MKSLLWFALANLGFCLCQASTLRQPPRLYEQPFHESPVRAGPDDLLVLAGDGLSASDIVVYQASSAAGTGTPPNQVPAEPTQDVGHADVVSSQGAPFELTIRMPLTILPDRPYSLWVRDPDGRWSNAAQINDPRPLWSSPSILYSSTSQASLPRYLKVVGRNLEPRLGQPIQVRLRGPRSYALDAPLKIGADASVERYAAIRRLPRSLVPGEYRVAVSIDSKEWVEMPGPPLRVEADPPALPEFVISDARFGGCRPDDGRDDTACIASAAEAAARAGGSVMLTKGTWDLRPGMLILAEGVRLRGAGSGDTQVVRHDGAGTDTTRPLLTLLGRNEISGVRFVTEHTYTVHDSPRPILQLGRRYLEEESATTAPAAVGEIRIHDNVFDKSFGAIVAGGAPIDRLLITFNLFGDYHAALELGGDRRNVRSRFGISDSVISHNRFVAGSHVDSKQNQGVLVSEIGASQRVDFSDNDADGASREFLNSPSDPPGWRAAFFFHMNDSHEMLLISNNRATCTGDKAGDGEAIALDNNANTFGLAAAAPVIDASGRQVRIDRPLVPVQDGRAVDLVSYYVGHWMRVVEGPGIGQIRRIVSYRRDAADGATTFAVDPAWDVVPQPRRSLITIAREFWQVYIVGNTIDQRKPPCTKANVGRPKGGAISIWGESADIAVEGNRQFDTDGILFQQQYAAEESDCADCRATTTIPSFLEIRGNQIAGEYDWDSACSISGIMASYAAAPNLHASPPPLSFAVSIAHNDIAHADGLGGGAISIQPTWYRGPEGYLKPLVQGIVIDHNRLASIAGRSTHPACGYPSSPRTGIRLAGGSNVAGTVLYGNSCRDVATQLMDRAVLTELVCDRFGPTSCECPRDP